MIKSTVIIIQFDNIVVHKILIMKREHIVLRTPSINSDITKPKLLESNGKRKSNNKIAIFSNKYNNLMSTHSLPQGSQQIPCQMTPLIKTNSEYASTSLCDSNSQRLSYESKPITEQHHQLPRVRQENLLNLIREEIGNVNYRYEAKMRELVQSNAKTICELRQILTEQQRKIVQKQLIIQKLISEKHNQNSDYRTNQLDQKLNLSEFNYLKSWMHDIEVKVMVLVQALADRDNLTASKMQDLQQKLIINAGNRLNKCKEGLQFILVELSKKIQSLQENLVNFSSIPKVTRGQNVDFLKTTINQMQKRIADFCSSEWKYQNPEVIKLKSILEEISQKIKQHYNQAPFVNQNYYFQDQDQFFYPSTQRVYQPSDQYQHFQQDSQDQGFKKQNKSPNYSSACKRVS